MLPTTAATATGTIIQKPHCQPERLGDLAGEHGAERRADHVGHAEDRDDGGVLASREAVEQEGLAERHQRGAGGALHDAPEDQLLERPGGAAHEGRDGEDRSPTRS